MINSEVDICNLALSLMKVPAITSITTPTNDEERTCRLWYDTSRKEILRKHSWNFAKKRVALSLCSDAPLFKYSDKYALPNDFIRLISIGEVEDSLVGMDYQIEEDKYLTIDNGSAASLYIFYIFDETRPARYDACFVKAFALQLAVNMCYSFAGKSTLRTDLRNMLTEALTEARAINGQDKPPIRVTKSRVIGARRQYGSGSAYRPDASRIYD